MANNYQRPNFYQNQNNNSQRYNNNNVGTQDDWGICWDFLSPKGCNRDACTWRHVNPAIDQRQRNKVKQNDWDICWDYLSPQGCNRDACTWKHGNPNPNPNPNPQQFNNNNNNFNQQYRPYPQQQPYTQAYSQPVYNGTNAWNRNRYRLPIGAPFGAPRPRPYYAQRPPTISQSPRRLSVGSPLGASAPRGRPYYPPRATSTTCMPQRQLSIGVAAPRATATHYYASRSTSMPQLPNNVQNNNNSKNALAVQYAQYYNKYYNKMMVQMPQNRKNNVKKGSGARVYPHYGYNGYLVYSAVLFK